MNQQDLDARSVEFYDGASKRLMKYVYPNQAHWSSGWLFYQIQGDSTWIILRKATDQDIAALNETISDALSPFKALKWERKPNAKKS